MKQLLMITLFAAMAVCCGSNKNTEQTSQGSVTTIGVEEFAKVIGKKNVRLIDVRTQKEYAETHIDGAENIDVKDANFAQNIKGITGNVAVYCRSGKRSMMAAEQLSAQGCTVYNLDGGIMAWQKAGRQTTKE